MSDFWKAYNCLGREGYVHLKVNHSVNFVDPDSGACSNGIESSWRAAKASSRRKYHIAGNLARYMFLKKCAETNKDSSQEFFRIAGKCYPGVVKFLGEIDRSDVDVASDDDV
jgi:hypothetical protein